MSYTIGQTAYVLKCAPPYTIHAAVIDRMYVNPTGGWPPSYVHAKWKGWGASFTMSGKNDVYRLFTTRHQARRERARIVECAGGMA